MLIVSETTVCLYPLSIVQLHLEFLLENYKMHVDDDSDNPRTFPTGNNEMVNDNESALRENIRLKGHNSYYYAHGNTAGKFHAVFWFLNVNSCVTVGWRCYSSIVS